MITFNIERTLDRGDIGSPEFDHVYRLTSQENPDGTLSGYVTDLRADGQLWDSAPDVVNDENAGGDVTVDRGWEVLTGNTGQYAYRGAVMHPSELWSRCHIEDLIRLADHPGGGLLYAVVEVRDEDGGIPDGDPIGWAVAYKLID